MKSIPEYFAHFRKNLSSILQDQYSHTQLQEVIFLSHAFALTLLRKKLFLGKIDLSVARLDLHDIAFDCIAELFRRNDENALVQLKTYFAGLEIDALSDAQLTDHLRRLVFSKVEQGIFRLYADHDQSLAKILRNIKLAVHALSNFTEVERFGETLLVPSAVNPNFDLPVMPKESLQEMIFEILGGDERIPDVMAKLSLRLRHEQRYAKAVSIVGIAVALRIALSEEADTVEDPIAKNMEIDDLDKIIVCSTDSVKKKYCDKYVKTKKISAQEYDMIFRAVQSNLSAVLIEKDGVEHSLYRNLSHEMPAISKTVYRKKYKAIAEYMLACSKKEIGKELKRT